MKKLLLYTIAICISTLCFAQHDGKPPKGHDKRDNMKIETFVTNLSTTQKTRIDVITRRSSKNIEAYRKQLGSVRDSIRSYMDSPKDHSSVLFPLYEREAYLQSEISKEYYRTKVAIDQILTPEQFQELNKKMGELRAQRHKTNPKQKGKQQNKN